MGDDTFTYAYLRKVTTCYLNRLKVEANRRCIEQALASAKKESVAATYRSCLQVRDGLRDADGTTAAAPSGGEYLPVLPSLWSGVVCEFCGLNYPGETLPFKLCWYCPSRPCRHHGRCCPRNLHGNATAALDTGDSINLPCHRERDHGRCDRATCVYQHVAPALASRPARKNNAIAGPRSSSPKPAGAKPTCHFFMKGLCKYGASCTHSHHQPNRPSSSTEGVRASTRSPSGRAKEGPSVRPKGKLTYMGRKARDKGGSK